MASKVGIISMALTALGQSRPVIDLTTTPQTVAISAFYDMLLPDLLTKHPWRFAMFTRELNLLVATPPIPKWSKAYQLPADYLIAYRLHPNGDYRIYEDLIYTNLDAPLLLDYLAKVVESEFPAYFEKLMVNMVAQYAAMMVTQQPTVAAFWKAEADQQLVLARTVDSQAMPSAKIQDQPILRSKFVGTSILSEVIE